VTQPPLISMMRSEARLPPLISETFSKAGLLSICNNRENRDVASGSLARLVGDRRYFVESKTLNKTTDTAQVSSVNRAMSHRNRALLFSHWASLSAFCLSLRASRSRLSHFDSKSASFNTLAS
jgi:hypothetical protein